MRNVKCDWSISSMQVGRNRTHPIFQKLYHTNIWTSSLYEFAILHSQTSWIIQVVSYKSFNVRPVLLLALLILSNFYLVWMSHCRWCSVCWMQLLVLDHGLNLIDEACNMSRHYFVSKCLQEISIIIILVSCLSFHASKSP